MLGVDWSEANNCVFSIKTNSVLYWDLHNSLWTSVQFAQECFWLGQITQLRGSEDEFCQPSISPYELYFLFQFHLQRKQDVLVSLVPIHASIHTSPITSP